MVDQIVVMTYIQTVAVIFGLGGVLAAVITLRQSFNQSIMASIGQISFDERSMGYFVVKIPGFIGMLFGKKPELPQLPTIDYLLRAGDNLVYTSAMIDQAPPSSSAVCWVNLHTQFLNQIALQQEFKDGDTAPLGIECVTDILTKAKSNVRRLRNSLAKERLENKESLESNERPESNEKFVDMEALAVQKTQGARRSSVTAAVGKVQAAITPWVDVGNPKSRAELSRNLDREEEHLRTRVVRETLYELGKSYMVKCVLDLVDEKELVEDSSSAATTQWLKIGLPVEIQPQWLQLPHVAIGLPGPQRLQVKLGFPGDAEARKLSLSQAPKLSRLEDFQQPRTVEQKPCIEVSREELAGLALALGMRLTMHTTGTIDTIKGRGPFGVSVAGQFTDSQWRLHVSHEHRREDRPTKGSGYSILFAKHIACGSLPFMQSKDLTHCVCVNEPVLQVVRKGGQITPYKLDLYPPSLDYLIALPAARKLFIYGASDETKTAPKSEDSKKGHFITTSKNNAWDKLTWPRVVARIAFGGLVPQANKTLVDAVQFTVGGRVNPCNSTCKGDSPCINAVQALMALRVAIDDQDRKAKPNDRDLDLFGTSGQDGTARVSIGSESETNCLRASNSRQTGTLFARYMTLLERLTAISGKTVTDVYEECCQVIDTAYQNVLLGEKKVADGGMSDNPERASEGQLTCDVEGVKDKINAKEPITANDCGKVARCIIAAWTWRVRQIHDLQMGHEDVKNVPQSNGGGGEGAANIAMEGGAKRPASEGRVMLDDGDSATMLDLPSVSFLGFS